MATPELTRWVTVLAAASLVACTPDVDGHGPTRDDVVDWQEVNVFQARLNAGAPGVGPVNTLHPECADGNCIDLRFVDPVCVRSVQPEDFTLVVLHIDEGGRDNALVLCGDEAFDTVLFSTSYTPRPYVDPAKLGAGTALEGCTDSSSTRFDTVSLHLSEEGARHLTPFTIPDGFERGRTMVFVQLNEQETPRCPSTGVDLVVETLVPDPDNPGQCDPRMPPCMLHLLASYSLRRAQGGTTTAFTVDDPRDGAPPFFVESSLRPRGTAPEGLLVEGDCPPDVCGAGSGPTPCGAARAISRRTVS